MTSPQSSRRHFLLTGGATIAGALTLAACGSDGVVNSSGTAASTLVAPTAPPTTADKKALAAANQALRTATSLELSIAAFYEEFVKATYLDAQTISLGTLIGGHHTKNAQALMDLTENAGGTAYKKPNRYLDEDLIAPGLRLANAAKSAPKLIELAATLEQSAASNSALAVGTLPGQTERAGIMAIGGANSRHATLWRLMSDPGNIVGSLPNALLSLRDAVGADADVS